MKTLYRVSLEGFVRYDYNIEAESMEEALDIAVNGDAVPYGSEYVGPTGNAIVADDYEYVVYMNAQRDPVEVERGET